VDPWQWVFTGGEDHTLVGTTAHEPPAGYRAIGEVVAVAEPEDTEGTEDADGTGLPPVTVDGRIPAFRGGWDSL
jgi:thiamine-monophosphate kinase